MAKENPMSMTIHNTQKKRRSNEADKTIS